MDDRPTVKESLRKIFVGGLNRKTDEASLSNYFSGFGSVVDCVVIRDKEDRSKGFGFVIFKDAESVDGVQKSESGHFIDSKEVETRRAVQRKGKQEKESIKVEANYPTKKIFLGGIKYDVEEKDLIEYFSNYAGVKSAEVIRDKEGSSRGFAYIVLDSQDAADKVCIQQNHVIKGRECEAKKSLSKNELMRHNKEQDGANQSGGSGNYGNGNNQNVQSQGQNWNQGQGQNYNTGQAPPGPQAQGQGPPGNWNQGQTPPGNWYGGQPGYGQGGNWNQGQWNQGQGGPPGGNWNQSGPWNWNQGPPAGGSNWNQGPWNWNQGGPGNWQGGWNQGGGPPQSAPDQTAAAPTADASANAPSDQSKPAGNGQWNQSSGGPGWQGQGPWGNWVPGNQQQGNWGNGPWGGWNQNSSWSGPPGGNWGQNGPPAGWNQQGGNQSGNSQYSAPQGGGNPPSSTQGQPSTTQGQSQGNWNQGQTGNWNQGSAGGWNANQGAGNRGQNGSTYQSQPGATDQKPDGNYGQQPSPQKQPIQKDGYEQAGGGGPMKQKSQRPNRNSGGYPDYSYQSPN